MNEDITVYEVLLRAFDVIDAPKTFLQLSTFTNFHDAKVYADEITLADAKKYIPRHDNFTVEIEEVIMEGDIFDFDHRRTVYMCRVVD